MLCSDNSKKFWKSVNSDANRVLISPKLDGVRCIAQVTYDKVKYFSRSGKEFHNFHKFDQTLLYAFRELPFNTVTAYFDGEVVSKEESFRKVMQNLRRLKDVNDSVFEYKLFDVIRHGVDGENLSWTLFNRLCDIMEFTGIDTRNGDVTQLEHNMLPSWVKGPRDFDFLLQRGIEQGYEGWVLKDRQSLYKEKRSSSWLKLKAKLTIDLPVVSWVLGKGKYKGKLGSLVCLLKNGSTVNVGTGLTDFDREEFRIHMPSMIEVEYQEITPDGSLRHPIFVCSRDDKEPN